MKRCFFNLRSDFDVILVFPIVRERSITFANLLRKRRNASYLLPRLSPSVSPSSPLKLGHTLVCWQLTDAETWLLTGSLCTAEEAPWAPSVCCISSQKDG